MALPHVINRNDKAELEDLGWPSRDAREYMVHELQARGHDVSVGQQHSGLHVIWLGADALSAGVDPRREGAALGD